MLRRELDDVKAVRVRGGYHELWPNLGDKRDQAAAA
jgi:hypothetical protein